MDLREILNDHQNLHRRLDDTSEEALEAWHRDMEAHLQAITDELGVQGVADLVHVVLELTVVNLDSQQVLERALQWFDALPPLLVPHLFGDLPDADLGQL